MNIPKTVYQFDKGFQVWQIMVNPNQLLIAELRNASELETVFICIDLAKDLLLWDDLSFENAWSFSLSHCDNKNVYIKEFEDNEQPIVKATLAITIGSKEVLWYKENTTIEEVYKEGVLLISEKEDNERRELTLINALNGENIQEIKQVATPIQKDILLPYSYSVDSAYYNTVSEFLKKKQQIEIVKDCDYFEFNSFIIVGFYTLNDGKLDNHLFIFDAEGKLMFKDLMGTLLTGIASESFFITQNHLVYVKNKQEIITLYLKNVL